MKYGDLIDRQAVLALPRNITKNMRGEIIEETIDVAAIKGLPSAQPEQRWITCSERMPEMHDAGILKKVGIKQRSKMVYITIEGKRNDGSVERITDAEAELRDGGWYSDTLRWLKAAGKKIEVTAWMPYPEPYNPEGDDKHGTD